MNPSKQTVKTQLNPFRNIYIHTSVIFFFFGIFFLCVLLVFVFVSMCEREKDQRNYNADASNVHVEY